MAQQIVGAATTGGLVTRSLDELLFAGEMNFEGLANRHRRFGLGLALVLINLGIMVPSGPGYVGTQEFFGTSALSVVGANPQSPRSGLPWS